MNKGFIMLERDFLDDDFYLSEKFTRPQAFIDLCFQAAYKERSFRIRGINVELKPCELAVSENSLAMRWRWSRNTVRKFIAELVDNGLIEHKTSKLVNIIIIKKYLITEQQTEQHKPLKDSIIGTNKGVNVKQQKEHQIEQQSKQQNEHSIIIDNKDNKEKEKEIDKPISKKNNDYSVIVECWNEHNGKTLGMVLRLTDKRKQNIKKILDAHGIDQEQLMLLFKTIPYADSWLYNPSGNHKTWKPDFDWWIANTNGWFTKALEGKVHKENYGKFVEIMGGNGNASEQQKEEMSDDQLLQKFFSTVSLEKEAEILGYNVDAYLALSDEKRQGWRTAYRDNFLDWIKENSSNE